MGEEYWRVKGSVLGARCACVKLRMHESTLPLASLNECYSDVCLRIIAIKVRVFNGTPLKLNKTELIQRPPFLNYTEAQKKN